MIIFEFFLTLGQGIADYYRKNPNEEVKQLTDILTHWIICIIG